MKFQDLRVIVLCAALAFCMSGVLSPETALAKSVYVISGHTNDVFDAYNINTDGTITYQATYDLTCSGAPGGLAVDAFPESEAALFVTFEGSNLIEVVDAVAFTSIGCVPAPGASNLAGIAVDGMANVVYSIDRNTDNLYAYDWDATAKTLTLQAGYPTNLPNCSAAMGLTLDDINGVLYVADFGGQMVRGYDVTNWNEVFSYAPTVYPLGIAVDRARQFLFISRNDGSCGFGGGSTLLCKYDLNSSTEECVTLTTNGSTHGGMGIAVDERTGYVYVTGGCTGDDISIWDPTTVPMTLFNDAVGDIGDPAGIAIGNVGVNPLNLAKTDGMGEGCARPGQVFTYTLTYDNTRNNFPIGAVMLTDDLPGEVEFQTASHSGSYDGGNHRVTWDVGTLAPDEAGSRQVTVRLAPMVEPGITIFNTCTIDGIEVFPTTVDLETQVCEVCEGIDLWLPDMQANPGEDIVVPVSIQDVTGWGVLGFDMEICWCDTPTGLLQYLGCEIGDVMGLSGWGDPVCGPCGGNCISVAGAGFTPLAGGGTLFNLIFHVSANAKPCMCCDLWFTHIDLYDPEKPLLVCWEDGQVCIDYCEVVGSVNNWYCRYDDCGEKILTTPIEDARMHLYRCDEALATTYTDPGGFYSFDCLPPLSADCPYCVEVDYCRVPRERIMAFDASLLLRFLVCAENLDMCPFYYCGCPVFPQQVAADVNCSGMITAYDASLILQYVVGMIPAFPCPDAWRWFQIPCHECANQCPDALDFIGVLVGDVSGVGPCPAGLLSASEATHVKLGIPRHDGSIIKVPVLVTGARDIFSAELKMDYNERSFDVVSVETSGPADDFHVVHRAEGGLLHIAMAGASSFSGDGRVAVITLQKRATAAAVADRLTLTTAVFNEGSPNAVIDAGTTDVAIARFALGPISPNPFNEGTQISYSAPQASRISLSIYNVNGQLVSTVFDGAVDAGVHQVTWDGTDAYGRHVSRGVYFCRMEAAGFTATEKVVLLK